MTDYQELFSRVMMKSAPAPLAVLARGEGARVWDVDGTEYLDFLAGIAVNALGHAHPVFVDAVSRQAARLAHVSNYFATEPQLELADRLTRLSGGDRVFLCNSGTEAIEAAVKLARLTGKPRILALENGFHGRTMGSLSLTGKPALRTPFQPLLPGVEHLPSSIEALEAALVAGDVAALVVEPIKGEAGVVELPEGYLRAARELTTRHGALLILDEIQTGAGRTGDWFAFQHEGIVPDAIALAKGIGGGFPIGALMTFGAASELFGPGHHGSTFGGNPLAASAANAVLGEIERADLVGNARTRGAELRARIELIGSPLVTDIQGRGLLLGVGLAEPVAGIVASRALDRGLIINAANEYRIRLAPPLIIGDEELHEFTRLFAEALQAVPSNYLHTDPGDTA
ncbi:acetylornithine transaminase [Homoserinibacter gongjuensis]|uniref:Acetylornithine aminotransferase n=1 Tax=Homoserinibacter gongjuensis TaxID=1162968 RepID=A0ABQ6JX43_9MICO|nr:acetylornithine transaminase [Homoserinibacter gongjuensis]GMA92880.1 acetylornithine aminotransferase [Homoserinibacter gongjuensis]